MTAPAIERLGDVRMDEVRLTTPVTDADLAGLKLGDVRSLPLSSVNVSVPSCRSISSAMRSVTCAQMSTTLL